MSIQIHPVKAFEDNYIWVLHNNTEAIVVDPGESTAVDTYLRAKQLTLNAILLTHHHYDHINGVDKLLSDWNCDIYGPEDQSIQFGHQILKEGDQLTIESMGVNFKVIETPGHTNSHICFYNQLWLFCGDTLFSIGCGRMFEGTPAEYVSSLNRIKTLDPSTQIYCAHEYTLSNLEFALAIQPDNNELLLYQEKIKQLRHQNKPSLPTRLATQLNLNPFLKINNKNFQNTVSKFSQCKINDEIQCFAQIRKLKDTY